MNPYHYRPLDLEQNEIRLVRVLPGSEADELRCDMLHEQLNENLEYQALSYAWTDPLVFPEDDTLEELVINGSSILYIQKNLASFLRQIRPRYDPTGLIWVDALAINQHNVVERNAQVLRMSDIYRMARGVIVWLGPEGHHSRTAMLFIKSPLNPGLSPSQISANNFAWWSASDLAVLESGIRTQTTVSSWNAVTKLFERAWWRRTWVVQEVLLGREVIFMCGHETATPRDLWNLLENTWAHSQWTSDLIPEGSRLLSTSSPARTVLWLRHTQHDTPRDLFQALYHLRPTHTSDPRDKVYGLLGLASDAKVIVPCPDYSLTLKEVYISLFKTMTSARGDLDWLTLAGDVENDAAFPSWCPDLTKKSAASSMNTSRSIADGRSIGFRAAGDSRPVVELDVASLKCTITGFVVDMVDGVGAGPEMHDTIPRPETNLSQPLSQDKAYQTDSETYEAIWKTLVADQDFEGTNKSWRAPPLFGLLYARKVLDAVNKVKANNGVKKGVDGMCHLGNWFTRNSALKFGGKTIEDWTFSTMTQSQAYDRLTKMDSFKFERRLQSTIGGRRLIVSEKGYLGIANERVRGGDHVCIFLGGRMPVVLRRVQGDDAYRFIGECYVHGLMDGQVWDALNEKELQADSLRRFVLC